MEIIRLPFIPFYSLGSRLVRGEGALLGLNALLLYQYDPVKEKFTAKLLISLIALALMYALNDIHDAPFDTRDTGRRNAWTAALLKRQKSAYMIHGLSLLAFIAICIYFFSFNPAFLLTAFAVSTAYNIWGKGKPGIDYLLVFLWGPTFCFIFCREIPLPLALNVGLMLLMNHTFQMSRDQEIDFRNDIRTAINQWGKTSAYVYYAAALGVFACFLWSSRILPALVSTVPFFIPSTLGFSRKGWLFAKVFQAASWLLIVPF